MSRKIVVPVVVDTNIIVPSLYMETPIFKLVLEGNLALCWNEFIYDEAEEIVKRLGPYYEKRIGVSTRQVLSLLNLIYDPSYKVPEMPDGFRRITADRDDDRFIWAAIKGGAEYIITKDHGHLLRLRRFRNIRIGRPVDFFRWVKRAHPM